MLDRQQLMTTAVQCSELAKAAEIEALTANLAATALDKTPVLQAIKRREDRILIEINDEWADRKSNAEQRSAEQSQRAQADPEIEKLTIALDNLNLQTSALHEKASRALLEAKHCRELCRIYTAALRGSDED